MFVGFLKEISTVDCWSLEISVIFNTRMRITLFFIVEKGFNVSDSNNFEGEGIKITFLAIEKFSLL